MFLIGETILDPHSGVESIVVDSSLSVIKLQPVGSDQTRHIALSSHMYKDYLFTDAISSPVPHTDSGGDHTWFLPTGETIRAKHTGYQYQWFINRRQASATKVWSLLYS